MEPVYSGIVERFPRFRERIMELCASDIAVCELCEDYDEVLKALSAIAGEPHVESKSVNELKELKRILEQELQERLDRNTVVNH
jgi:uncharacterized protein YdcH (DUF465 family)